MIKEKKGIALIAVVMLIVFISIAVLGLSTFIVQWFDQLDTDVLRAQCLYLAQAGIQDAIYQVRSQYLNPATTYGSYTTGSVPVTDNLGNSLGTYRRGGTPTSVAADFLLVNTANVSWNSATRTLSGVKVQKVLGSVLPAVTIASVNVCWSPNNKNIISMNIGGSTWGALAYLACPGNNANITDLVLSTTAMPITLVWATKNTFNLTSATMRFNMLDGSTKTVVLYPVASATKTCPFIINSTGMVAGDPKNTYRTIRATYDLMPATYAADSKITDIDEIEEKVTTP